MSRSAHLHTMDEGLRIGAFARRAGVTVRALHHYDRLGLLRPSRRGSGEYRLYADGDLVRLQQIVTLKALGFDLERVAKILDAPGFDVSAELRAQIGILEDRRRRIDAALTALRFAESDATGAEHQPEAFVRIIKAMIDMHDIDFSKYYTPEQLAALRAREPGEGDAARASERWNELLREIDASLDADPSSQLAQGFVDRWDALIAEFTHGDPGIERSLASVYADPENREKAAQAMPGLPRAWAFIQKARATRSEPEC
jgi:DNA-binding transcriptional MerR regulator